MDRKLSSEGMCYGFQFRSELALQTLRTGSGPVLEVVEGHISSPTGAPLSEWPELVGQRARAAVYSNNGSSYTVTIGAMGRFLVDLETPSIRADLATALPMTSKEGLVLSTPSAICITARGDLALHAASVDTGRGGVILAATGSGGKTTLAAAFHHAGFRTLADDLTRCGGRPPLVYPGPALIRLRLDAADKLDLLDVNPASTRAGKVHFVINQERRGAGTSVPLAAIVFLEWTTDRDVQMDRIDPHEAVMRLWPLSFYLPGDYQRARCFESLVDLTQGTPSFVLKRPKNYGLLPEAVHLIAKTSDAVTP